MTHKHTHEPQPQADGHADSLAYRVSTLIADALDVMPLEVLPGCALRDDLGATDHDIDRLRRMVERQLRVYVPLPEAEAWREVADVVAYVQRRLA